MRDNMLFEVIDNVLQVSVMAVRCTAVKTRGMMSRMAEVVQTITHSILADQDLENMFD